MKDFGYYYSECLKMMMIGFLDKDDRLHGKVIKDKYFCYGYGYKYDRWKQSDFRYIGNGNPTEYYILIETLKHTSEV